MLITSYDSIMCSMIVAQASVKNFFLPDAKKCFSHLPMECEGLMWIRRLSEEATSSKQSATSAKDRLSHHQSVSIWFTVCVCLLSVISDITHLSQSVFNISFLLVVDLHLSMNA